MGRSGRGYLSDIDIELVANAVESVLDDSYTLEEREAVALMALLLIDLGADTQAKLEEALRACLRDCR